MHRRVQQQPAFVLHHRPFRDSSQILDVISRDHGKLAVVARGSRGARSRLKGVLRPFMPLSISWIIKSDLGTLTGAEVRGAPLSLSGDALLSGFYVNELILHFLHRHDPQPEIFEAYALTIEGLAVAGDDVAPCLRRFEVELLRQSGYALNLDHEYDSNRTLDPQQNYEYRAEQGPVAVSRAAGPLIFSGKLLAAIGAQQFDDADVLRAANRLLREVIAFHLGGKELKSRKVLQEMRRL
ncbi:MAG: DNA repair protein RecO [Gammaproteobacteria bacterium]|nr:DNA repair protein RecO [Gammaproteobacteria bacterium]MDH3373571.1 DNA repair protein RecO [Gammaproteobacteria bacterium]MDH3410757.1 DNA repair protein RecO [Gammaproteobacteria bacterium]